MQSHPCKCVALCVSSLNEACAISFDITPFCASCGEFATHSGRSRPKFGRMQADFDKLGIVWPDSRQLRGGVGQLRPVLACVGLDRPDSTELGPTSTGSFLDFNNFGQRSTGLGRSRTKFPQYLPSRGDADAARHAVFWASRGCGTACGTKIRQPSMCIRRDPVLAYVVG